ncbi:MAG: 16S rRNA (cytosine(1402)-N(4))-methyltransferase RsmH [Gemmatimonadota bacterium]|nr:16S rRNA (cytosine(1402)-N(4))-methyltransferase RsmH [Gemmatimonadota bacterium]
MARMSAAATSGARWDSAYHAPVLVEEVSSLLRGSRTALDCTLGGGGHAQALLESGVQLVTALDRDPEAIAAARARLAAYERAGQFRAILGNYARVDELPELREAQFDGVLLDLGVSSHQVDDLARGFSFRPGALLDMRMGEDASETAADVLNDRDERELTRIFKEYADEPRAARLAREVVRRRQTRPFQTSDDLVNAIRASLGPRAGPAEFARLFQGIRIAVNDELGELDRALPRLRERLRPGGTLAVIAYHSGEGRRVKLALREWSTDCICPPRQPVCTCRGRALGKLVTRKATVPTADELARNPRSRSAKLRAWRKGE